MVFLHEGARGDVFAKPVVAEGFHKEAALVAVDLGLEEFDVGKGSGKDVHELVVLESVVLFTFFAVNGFRFA